MARWIDRLRVPRRPAAIIILVTVGGGLLLVCCCGGGLIVLPDVEPSKSAPKNNITLTHADRVLLTAEQMHVAGIRADPADSLDTQLKIAAFGKQALKSPRTDAACEWRLSAFHDEKCFLRIQAGGPWTRTAARAVVGEFNQYSRTLSPGAGKQVAALIHAIDHDTPRELRAAGYRFRITLHEENQSGNDGYWEMLIELWPLPEKKA